MEEQERRPERRKLGKMLFIDIIIIGVLLAVAVFSLEWMLDRRIDGAVAVVELDGERVAEYALS